MKESIDGRALTAPPGEPHVAPEVKTSAILARFLLSHETGNISFGEIRNSLDDRAFGLLMVILALPNLIPIIIPGLSTILGIPLAYIGLQLMAGRRRPWFPLWITERSFSRSKFQAVIARGLPWLARTERILKPRAVWLAEGLAERLIGFTVLILALTLSLPIPFGNALPALAIVIFGLALIEKDGLAALAGYVLTGLSYLVIFTVAFAAVKAMFFFIARIFTDERAIDLLTTGAAQLP